MLTFTFIRVFCALLATSACLFLLLRFHGLCKQKVVSAHLRGRNLSTGREAQWNLARSLESSDPGLQLGRLVVPSPVAYSHAAIVGATGSGKTLVQRLLMQSVLPRIGQGFGHRALIYDAKQDVLSVLAGMKLSCPIRTLNPLDARAAAWDMAADITSPASAFQVASLLIPESKGDSNPFFSSAARHLLYGALVAFIQKPGGRWTFRELLLTLREPVRLKYHLEKCEATRHLLQYFEHTGTSQNILSTMLTYLAPFEVIAATWDHAPQSLSLTRWIEEESILVLGNDEANRTAVEAMNRLIFRRLSEIILSQPELSRFEADSRRTWLFLDEVREAGKLEGLSRLLTKGRSKGAAVVLGFQDIAGLHDVYGKDVAEELVGQCSIKVILRLNSPDTAAWASRLIGSREVIESRRSQSHDCRSPLPTLGPTGETLSHGVATRRVVLESEFFDLPVTSPPTGLTGFFITPLTGAFKEHLPGSWLNEHLLAPDPNTPNFIPRPAQDQYLRPWSAALKTEMPNHQTQFALSQG